MGFDQAIYRVVDADKPFLGICVGMQVLFEDQEEGNTRGLGLLPGRVRSIGKARAQRWLAPPLAGITTHLLLTPPLPSA